MDVFYTQLNKDRFISCIKNVLLFYIKLLKLDLAKTSGVSFGRSSSTGFKQGFIRLSVLKLYVDSVTQNPQQDFSAEEFVLAREFKKYDFQPLLLTGVSFAQHFCSWKGQKLQES